MQDQEKIMQIITHKKYRPTLNAQEHSATLELFNWNGLHHRLNCFSHGLFVYKPLYQLVISFLIILSYLIDFYMMKLLTDVRFI